MASEPVIFNTVLEGARKAYGKRLTPELLAKLRGVGLDFEKPNAAYPMETFLVGLQLIADAISPGLSHEEQHLQIGRDFMHGFKNTAIGFAMMNLGKVVGIRRTLQRVGRNLKTTGNYVEAEVHELGDTEVEIVTRVLEEFRPHITPRWRAIAHYRKGIFESGLDILGADGTVELSEPSPHETRFSVKWKLR